VGTVAARIGMPAEELARHNTLPDTVTLREGEILALPRRVAEPTVTPGGTFDVASIGTAIDRADGGSPGLPTGAEPTRHRVAPGETAFSIARTYGVPVASLAEWNGLGPDLGVRVGQYLLIPVAAPQPSGGEIQVAAVAPPGGTSTVPLPPSAAQPLPAEKPKPAAAPAPKPEPLQDTQTAASDTAKLRMPVQGRIIRAFEKGKNEGIGIAADAGSAVVAADAGTVAAITRDTDQVPILVIRHSGNLLTVYAGVDEIAVQKGDQVKRGEKIAVVRAANPPFLHFEVREGFDSVDPSPYLN
jgi:murein DD-endopeptidase MepM/ murein hydrolase activator NlpD